MQILINALVQLILIMLLLWEEIVLSLKTKIVLPAQKSEGIKIYKYCKFLLMPKSNWSMFMLLIL